jgi:hypothetical protein
MLLYALVQLVSWGALVIKLQPSRMAMVVGEGAVFLFLLGIGAYFLHRSIRKTTCMNSKPISCYP